MSLAAVTIVVTVLCMLLFAVTLRPISREMLPLKESPEFVAELSDAVYRGAKEIAAAMTATMRIIDVNTTRRDTTHGGMCWEFW